MLRKIIRIDEENCDGCGLCAEACHEGAIAVVDGKARLLREDYCDGLGDCLPACPQDAIHIEEREAAAYDEAAVQAAKQPETAADTLPCGCPSHSVQALEREPACHHEEHHHGHHHAEQPGELSQWPVQIKLLPVDAPFFDGAKLLIAADCTAFACAGFHREFIRGRVTLVGCPKLDSCDYSEKLAEIIRRHEITDILVARMEVPCCGGLVEMVKRALADSGKVIPWQVRTINAKGEVL